MKLANNSKVQKLCLGMSRLNFGRRLLSPSMYVFAIYASICFFLMKNKEKLVPANSVNRFINLNFLVINYSNKSKNNKENLLYLK